jgi:hypothetical protein
MVLADLQRGEIDEAEDSLEQAVRSGGDEAAGFPKIDRAIRAEILLARGDIEAGLHSWRQAAEGMRGSQSWALEVRTAAVIAHARHGRLDLVKETTAELPGLLSKVITDAMATSPESFTEFPLCGALLLALAMVDIDRGATTSGARMIALAQRLRFVRDFQPTMSAARAEDAAERADRVAYADALSAYALLDRDELRAAALAALTERDPV